MSKGLLVLNIVLLALVAVLFYLHFSRGKKENVPVKAIITDSAAAEQKFRIAYFDMDSVENNFALAKEMQTELMRKDENIAAEMNRMQSSYQQKFQKLQQEGPTMTQTQGEAAQRDLYQMEQNIKSRKMQLDQEYQSYYMGKQQEIISLIKKFCEEFNKDKKYSLIIANEPGLIYYKDTSFNITPDLLKGLNEMYSKQKKKQP
jgi:outer membrane protein